MKRLLDVVDAIFFDCDGVLIDSVHVKERQFRAMMEERIPKHADAAMDYYWANGGTSRLAKFRWIWAHLVGSPLTETEVEALGREFQSRVVAGVVACPMLPGAKDFLDEYGVALPFFVLSGTPNDELNRVIEARRLRQYFREICGSPRTKTEIGRDLLERYGFDPERVWFVGDATTDLEAARNLGLHFVGIDGPHLTPFIGPSERLIKDLTMLEQAILAPRT
jgi:phosphoglycolate phosphatase-like HAD superfamily hydrolase